MYASFLEVLEKNKFSQQMFDQHINHILVLGLQKMILNYRNDPKFSDRYAWSNSADPDQTAPRGAV